MAHRDVPVNYFDLVQEFIEYRERAATTDDLATRFGKTIRALGFRYFACCSHVDPLRPPPRAVVIHSYPMSWVQSYSERQLFQIDPIFLHADQRLLPFFWDSSAFRARLTPQQEAMLAEASEFGIAHGYTIPIHLPGSWLAYRGSCSVVPDAVVLDMPSYYAVQIIAYYMYEVASRNADAMEARATSTELSKRERQCLELVAQGKSDWVIGKLLGISERTVHNHIERAKRRLGVTTRVQAIVLALATRQISFGDVIKAEAAEHRSDSK
jgi:DNA-binding CsgD family transcriptional regulator